MDDKDAKDKDNPQIHIHHHPQCGRNTQGHAKTTYGCTTDHSMDDKDARIRITPKYTSITTRSVAETPKDMQRQHMDASGRLKDTPDGYTDLAETHGLGLRIFIFLMDVSQMSAY